MTAKETIEFLTMMQTIYPNFKPSVDKKFVIGVWQDLFKDVPFQQMQAALRAFAVSENAGYSPTPGQLMQFINANSKKDDVNGEEAWDKVLKALRNSSYHAEEEFEKLPEVIKKAIGGNPGCLRTLAVMDMNTLNSVEKSHFLRAYAEEYKTSKIRKMASDTLLGGNNFKTDSIEGRI